MNTGNTNRAKPAPPPWRTIIKHLLVTLLVIALILFLPAGSLVWMKGWLFLIVFMAAIVAAVLYLRRVNPEIFVARSRIHKETKLWDKILLCFLLPAFFAVLVVAALDNGRFKWSELPWWIVGVGYALFAAGFMLTVWAEAVNRFFEPGVRIQTERGHYVVNTGPYAFVRHPGYVGAFLLCAGMALSLGSLWALIPVCFGSLLIILRTILEDRLLRRELPGYQEYCQKVRFRLIPGVW